VRLKATNKDFSYGGSIGVIPVARARLKHMLPSLANHFLQTARGHQQRCLSQADDHSQLALSKTVKPCTPVTALRVRDQFLFLESQTPQRLKLARDSLSLSPTALLVHEKTVKTTSFGRHFIGSLQNHR
jgi:hypothetical protein